MLEETFVICPSCWESVPLLIDRSEGNAQYTEDCPVCCRPMTVTVNLDCKELEVWVRAENE